MKSAKNKNVLVTGGAGFLGSHVADCLSDEGYSVIIYDRIESPYLKSDQKMIIGDLLDEKKLSKATKNCFAVYHFAGVAGIEDSNNNPLAAVKANILGTVVLLNACVQNKVSRFMFASSIYVYSDHGGIYRSTKQACEMLIENYSKMGGLDYTIMRFGSLYGKRANHFNWIYNIIHQALSEKKMERIGDGEEIREYIHVTDASKNCVTVLDEKYKNNYVMITGNQSMKVKDLLKMIAEMLDSKIEVLFVEGEDDGHYEITPYSFRPRTAKKIISVDQIELGQGILDTIFDVYNELKKD